jgi:hypothetical protein
MRKIYLRLHVELSLRSAIAQLPHIAFPTKHSLIRVKQTAFFPPTHAVRSFTLRQYRHPRMEVSITVNTLHSLCCNLQQGCRLGHQLRPQGKVRVGKIPHLILGYCAAAEAGRAGHWTPFKRVCISARAGLGNAGHHASPWVSIRRLDRMPCQRNIERAFYPNPPFSNQTLPLPFIASHLCSIFNTLAT